MQIGDKVGISHKYSKFRQDCKRGVIEYISRYGWVAVRFPAGYAESFWRDEVTACEHQRDTISFT